jgi:predicted  nucleic acid-binding Zn-ribbon protein
MNQQIKAIISVPTTSQNVVNIPPVTDILAILVSISVLGGIFVKLINNQNHISSSIEQIETSLKEYSVNTQKIRDVERALDLHFKDYSNQNQMLKMVIDQLEKKVDDRTKRAAIEIKEMQRFLQRDMQFIIRERADDDDDN